MYKKVRKVAAISATVDHLYTLKGKKKKVTQLKIQRQILASLYFKALR